MQTDIKNWILILLFAVFGCSEGTKIQPFPPTVKMNQVDTIHGVAVSDPYRWLEDWEDPSVQEWSSLQNQYARQYLDQLPAVSEITGRIETLLQTSSESYYSLHWQAGRLFALKNQPPLDQPLLVVRPSIEETENEHVILDLNLFDPQGSTSIDWYRPTPGGDRVAVSLSRGGSESGDLHIFDTESGDLVDIVIERVNGGTAGGDVAWTPDGKGFYYTRYPREGERPSADLNFYQQLWYHKMGTTEEEDRYIFGQEFPRIAEIRVETEKKTGALLLSMQYGDSGRFAHYLLPAGKDWQQITSFEDEVVEAFFGPSGQIFLVSMLDSPRGKILSIPLADPTLENFQVVVPESQDTIVSDFYYKTKIAVTPNRLYVTYQLGGPNTIRSFDLSGNVQPGPELKKVSSVYELETLDGDDIIVNNATYLEPAAWLHFDADTGVTSRTALFVKSPIDFSDSEVIRDFATSRDGTEIPVNIIQRKGTQLDGKNPALLYGYGGFNLSRTPGFNPLVKLWIEQGGVYAVANIRGGGEFGRLWHEAGRLTQKQNCFDDFAAVMEFLIAAGYTNPQRLAIMGGSNGGLLMGAMITQHPDRFRATVSSVGLYDMIRSELTPNGSFNIPEYGTVKDPEQFRALFAYSPYHNVKEGKAYPSVLFLTGANDPRVDPMHSRKMTAQLQSATSAYNPVLLRTSSTTGHGIGSPVSEIIKENVDRYAFLFHELGVDYRSPTSN